MKIYRASYDAGEGGGIAVDVLEAEEKAKTYRILDNGYSFSIRKDEVGHVFFDRLSGYGLTDEEAMQTLRRSAENMEAHYQKKVDLCHKIAALVSDRLHKEK